MLLYSFMIMIINKKENNNNNNANIGSNNYLYFMCYYANDGK